MYCCLSNYYKIFEDHNDVKVKTVFFRYTDIPNISNLESDYDIDGNILYIKGKESFLPGVLEKTLKAFKYYENDLDNYDYIIRTNISTIVDFQLLAKELHENPINFYGGGNKRVLQWTGGGINDSKWFGTEYIEGTAIIFSREAIKYIITHDHLIRKDIIDDVSFAILMREHRPDVVVQDLSNYFIFVPCFFIDRYTININGLHNMVNNNNYIFYRNKCCNHREIDVAQMNIIKDILLHKEK
jgi:hypothetical protein